MATYRIYVRAELYNDDTDERITWDDDTFFFPGERHQASERFQRVTEAAGRAAVDTSGGGQQP